MSLNPRRIRVTRSYQDGPVTIVELEYDGGGEGACVYVEAGGRTYNAAKKQAMILLEEKVRNGGK